MTTTDRLLAYIQYLQERLDEERDFRMSLIKEILRLREQYEPEGLTPPT